MRDDVGPRNAIKKIIIKFKREKEEERHVDVDDRVRLSAST